MEANHIDELLERYLHLLHEYTTLREQLSTLQTGMYQNIARANFAAERGMRFGQDCYDERMQASRRISVVTSNDQDVPVFTVTARDAGSTPSQVPDTGKGTASEDGTQNSREKVDEKEEKEKDEEAEQAERKKKQPQRKDPLRWFGLLTPMALRQAQAQSIEAIEKVIPKLVSVNSQMAQIEIEVRRARKKRAKAEAAAKKEHDIGAGTEITASS
ncbi:hypothetical protein GGS26DRAFT_495135 [Hypomontagnella submonticulosa]|nr:hypothetical protein GGS26DRAFT_495135 [Hypomontagnella submonticulosa]